MKKDQSPRHQKSDAAALVGRTRELAGIHACLEAKRNVLLEGPVGVGKTHLALAVTEKLGRPVYRVDGDSRYSEQKLAGWFDPPTVMKKGFSPEAFVPGPLTEAMRAGGILFINEMNRLPEGVQNILLPAIDERLILVPRLGEVRAAEGFLVIATQNPKEFVATSHLSEAILDRFELVIVDYQTEDEERDIVRDRLRVTGAMSTDLSLLVEASVRLVRKTRNHPRIRRGASIRAALSLAEIGRTLMNGGKSLQAAFSAAALMALPTRIEVEREMETGQNIHAETETLLHELLRESLDEVSRPELKKKT